jgi:hypothetical protein
VDAFVLDGRVVRLPARTGSDGRRAVLDRELDAVYVVAPDATRVEIVAGGSIAAARVAFMRVVRELAASEARRHGALLLHAAALGLGGRAVLLVGPKRAGKTTLLLRALAIPGATFVANDRVVVGPGAMAVARGMPSIVAVRPEVLGALGAVGERVRVLGYRHDLTMAEARRSGATPPPGGGADLTPAQLCDVLGVRAAAEDPIGAIVFPCATPGRGAPRLERLSAAAALPRLLDGLFGGPAAPVSAVFADPAGPAGDGATVPSRCRHLLDRVPAFLCPFDPAGADPAAVAAAIDGALRDAAAERPG